MASLPRKLKLRTPRAGGAPPRKPNYKLSSDKLLLYADRGMVVVNKPNGLISQLSDPQKKRADTNVDADVFMSLLDDIRQRLHLQETPRHVHRLDKPTTGALVLAANRKMASDFSKQISQGEAEKTYLALVCGGPEAFTNKKTKGTIDTSIQCQDGRVRIPDVKGVYERERKEQPARGETWTRDNVVSDYEVLAHSPRAPLSLLKLRLHTGCKHQLRVHLAQYLRTPVFGDTMYLDPKSRILLQIKEAIEYSQCLYLHSSRFSLNRYLPSRCRLTVGAPLPSNFVEVCRRARIALDYDDETGGVWVDGQKVRGADVVTPVEEDAVAQLGGTWYGPSRQDDDGGRW